MYFQTPAPRRPESVSVHLSPLKLNRHAATALLTLLALSSMVTSCSISSVEVKRLPSSTERIGAKSKNEEERCTAHTDWFFHCQPKFDYVLSSIEQSESHSFAVQLVIKKVEMKLTLPIKVFATSDAMDYVIEHENGHVKICNDVYDGAEVIAQTAAGEVIGETFSGTGASKEEAQQKALDEAAKKICSAYRAQTVDHVNRVSSIYDWMSKTSPQVSIPNRIKAAFERDK
jgi:hypothetical protein